MRLFSQGIYCHEMWQNTLFLIRGVKIASEHTHTHTHSLCNKYSDLVSGGKPNTDKTTMSGWAFMLANNPGQQYAD